MGGGGEAFSWFFLAWGGGFGPFHPEESETL